MTTADITLAVFTLSNSLRVVAYVPQIATALRDMGFSGTVGLEGYAAGDDVAALEAFRSAFTV